MKKTIFINTALYEKGKQLKDIVFCNNTGNMLFAEAMHEQINYDEEYWLNGEISGLPEAASAVIPTSNFIRYGSSAKYFLNFLKKTNCSVTLAGLGAQSSTTILTPKEIMNHLQKEKIDCLKMFSERAVTLGVRGEFTAQCLEEIGIHNYRVIGCPSMFLYFDGKFPMLRKPTLDKPMINITGRLLADSRTIEIGERLNAKWVMQSAEEMPEIAFGTSDFDSKKLLKNFPGLKISPNRLKSYMKNNAVTFNSFKEWRVHLRNSGCTFSFGTRFHGNMCALLAGIPALWITHDSRTEELVKTLHLPHISCEKYESLTSIEDMLELCNYDDFYSNYQSMEKEYVKFLEENQLSHHFQI